MKIQIVSTKGYTTFYPNAVCFYKIGEIYEVKNPDNGPLSDIEIQYHPETGMITLIDIYIINDSDNNLPAFIMQEDAKPLRDINFELLTQYTLFD